MHSSLLRIGILIALLLVSSVAFAQQDSLETIDTTTATTVDSALAQNDSTIVINGKQVYPLTPEREAQLIDYSKFKDVWRFISFFISLGIFAIFLFTGLSAKIRNWAMVAKKKYLVVLLYVAIFLGIYYLIDLPFNIYRGYIIESNFGFMNQSFLDWWSEGLLSLGISILVGSIPAYFVYMVIEKYKRWWLWFALGAIPFMVVILIVWPIFISPLFNDFVSLEDQQLKSELLTLAEQAGIEGSDVYQVNASKQSTKINAYVTGLFGSKRIVLYDTMIDSFTKDEIRFVMGHEMGHYVMNHMWIGLGVAVLMIAFLLWLANLFIHKIIRKFADRFKFNRLADIASLPLLMAVISVLSFITDPITNGLSRYHEHESDIFGMDVARIDGETAARSFDKIAALNLSDPDPSPFMEFWFHDHPALKKRMAFVRSYQPQERNLD